MSEIDTNTFSCYFGMTYTGQKKPPDAEKPLRRLLNLPVTKQLVFYKYRDGSEVENVKCFRVIGHYNITNVWYSLEVLTENDNVYNVHSSYFAEMQKPSFIDDMKNMIVDKEPLHEPLL